MPLSQRQNICFREASKRKHANLIVDVPPARIAELVRRRGLRRDECSNEINAYARDPARHPSELHVPLCPQLRVPEDRRRDPSACQKAKSCVCKILYQTNFRVLKNVSRTMQWR